MKKEDIHHEFISKIEIKIEDTLFYIPEETIKGSILINPTYQMDIKDKILHLSLKLMQYEFWERANVKIEEIKNIHITKIQEENIEYKLKPDDITETQLFESFSLIEKENKMISIPFQIKIKNEKILPTFQFQNKDYFLGIRHLLLVECQEYNSSNYIGLFIGKIKNQEYYPQKIIKENYKVGLDSLEVIANFKKLSYTFDEQLDYNVKTNTNLHFQKITKIKQEFYRKIEWIGYVKNSVLSKDILDNQKVKYNENEYGFFLRLTMPLASVVGTVALGTVGGFMGTFGGASIGYGGTEKEEISKIVNSESKDNKDKDNTNKNNNEEQKNVNDNSDVNKINDNNNDIKEYFRLHRKSKSDNNIMPDSSKDANSNDIKEDANKVDEQNNNNDDSDSCKDVEIEGYIKPNPTSEPNNINNNNIINNNNNIKNNNNEDDETSFLGGIIGGIFGGIIGTSVGAITGFVAGTAIQFSVMKDILNLNDNHNNIYSKFETKLSKPEYEKILIDSLKKFVYFKDNKVVGFIKFAYNIVPPIDGYYFKCNYNIKIKLEINGIILSSKKYLKTKVDLYDSEEYVSNMKKIFKTEKQ